MSQMPALARTDLRSPTAPARRAAASARAPRSAPARAPRPAPGHLKLVTAAPRPARQMPFVVLMAIVLAAGLLALLFLNMQLAKGSYALHDLQRRSTILAEQQEALGEQLSTLRAPGVLAAKATGLGMVPGSSPAFLRLPDGQVLGVPQAAPSAPSTAKPSAKSSAKASPTAKASPAASAEATSAKKSPTAKPSAKATGVKTAKGAGTTPDKPTAASSRGSSGVAADRATSGAGR